MTAENDPAGEAERAQAETERLHETVVNGHTPRRANWKAAALGGAVVAMAMTLFALGLAGEFDKTAETAESTSEVRANQCGGLRDQMIERIIIIQDSPQPTRLTRFWTNDSLPRVRMRMERIGCGNIPVSQDVRRRYR
jgi:hypothetical protein